MFKDRFSHLTASVVAGVLGVLTVSGISVALAGSAGASSNAPNDTLSLTVLKAPASQKGVDLEAVLSSSGTEPVSGDVVTFSIHLREFAGSPLLVIGKATTDAAGSATINYQPLWNGSQSFVASAADSSGTTLATAAATATAARTDPFAGSVESSRTDGLLGRWTIVALLSFIVGLWIALIGVVVRNRRGIRTSAV